jgi:ABC-2 type transport system ATP-binding protein
VDGHVDVAVRDGHSQHRRPVGGGGACRTPGIEQAFAPVLLVDDLVDVTADADAWLAGLCFRRLGDGLQPRLHRPDGAVGDRERDATDRDGRDRRQTQVRGVHVAVDGGPLAGQLFEVGERTLRVEVADVDDVVGRLDALAELFGNHLFTRRNVRVRDDCDVHTDGHTDSDDKNFVAVGLRGRLFAPPVDATLMSAAVHSGRMAAIEVDGLTKDYGTVLANDDLSFSVAEGEVFGYLGPNGAGKTTTIRTLMGFQAPTAGGATVLGHDVTDEASLVEAKRRIGYLPSNPSFDETATGREILDFHADIKGGERREDLLSVFDPPLDRKIRAYSTGNVQKLGIVQAFMHDPDLVVFDEPTGGLDPLMQREFNEFLREETERGLTVFLSSHVLSEVRRVCDRVGILREGRLVTTETVETLLDRTGKFVRAHVAGEVDTGDFDVDGVHDPELASTTVAGEVDTGGEGNDDFDGEPSVTEVTFTYTGDVNALLTHLEQFRLVDLTVEEAPLEEVFMRFYGEDGGDDRA